MTLHEKYKKESVILNGTMKKEAQTRKCRPFSK